MAVRLYPNTRSRSRRQANWGVGIISIVVLLMVSAYVVSSYTQDASMFLFLLISEVASLIFGMGLVAAILKDDLIPINRTAAASATYAVLVVFFALIFEFILEPIVAAGSESLGADPNVGQTILIVGIALAAPRVKSFVAPVIERLLQEPNGSKQADV